MLFSDVIDYFQSAKHSASVGKRPKSRDDRSNNGIPIFTQERVEDRAAKKVGT